MAGRSWWIRIWVYRMCSSPGEISSQQNFLFFKAAANMLTALLRHFPCDSQDTLLLCGMFSCPHQSSSWSLPSSSFLLLQRFPFLSQFLDFWTVHECVWACVHAQHIQHAHTCTQISPQTGDTGFILPQGRTNFLSCPQNGLPWIYQRTSLNGGGPATVLARISGKQITPN